MTDFDHEISFIPGKEKTLSLENTGYFLLCGRNAYPTLALNGKCAWSPVFTPDAGVGKTLPSIALGPNLGSFSCRLERAHRSWDGYNFGWMPTDTLLVDRKGFSLWTFSLELE